MFSIRPEAILPGTPGAHATLRWRSFGHGGDRQERRQAGAGGLMDLPPVSREYRLASGPLTSTDFIVTNYAKPAKDAAWFTRKIAELRTELDKLPPGQREQFLKTFKN